MQVGMTLLSDDIQKELKIVEKSVVGVNTRIRYEIQNFSYLTKNGKVIYDPNSPVRYKLDSKNGDTGIVTATDYKTLSGGGLIIDLNNSTSMYTILTSSHLVFPEDTTDIYFLDENGIETDVLFARYIVKDIRISVLAPNNWRAEAELIANDPVSDLAVIAVNTERLLGAPFPNPMGYEKQLGWGDWVFLFGYPKGIKQLTGGWVSEAPYRGTLGVDAVVRYGYSGGPVFAIDDAKLIFVGLIKSVPRSTLEYVAPDASLPLGYHLTSEDLGKLVVKREIMVEYGTAYFVSPQAIKEFMKLARAPMENRGVELAPKYYR